VLLSQEFSSEDGEDWVLSDSLTSQSSRSGSATFANEHREMQTQWILPRGGWTLDGVQTIFNYVSGTGKTDARVGRALSGWPSIQDGGVSPTIECIPEADRAMFRSYAVTLMGSAQVTEGLRNLLTCALLLRYEQTSKLPHLQLVHDRMTSVEGIDASKVIEWGECCRKGFVYHNALFLPHSDTREGDVVPVVTLHEFMAASQRSHRVLHERMSELCAVVGQLVAAETARAPTSAPVAAGSSGASRTPAPVRGGLITHFVEAVPPTTRQVVPNYSADLASLSKWTVQQLFFKWYVGEMHKTVLQPGSSKDNFKKCAKLMFFLKKLCPDNTRIRAPPSVDRADDRTAWVGAMRELSVYVDGKATTLFGGNSVTAAFKAVDKLDVSQLPSVTVVDDATVPALNFSWIDIQNRKRGRGSISV
jgi:hypothetical protein